MTPYELPADSAAGVPVSEERFPSQVYDDLAIYLDLLLRWNAKTNLTAVRDPREIVMRHFGESLFFGKRLVPEGSVLDFGSGSGIPGIPVQILDRRRSVVLAESQNKKGSFLREVVRTLQLNAEVWSGRVELMPSSRTFRNVVLRAVDNMDSALPVALNRTEDSLYLFTTLSRETGLAERLRDRKGISNRWSIPNSIERVLLHYQ